MEKTFSCRIDDEIHSILKAKLLSEGITVREWLESKIIDETSDKKDDAATKISDFQDKYVKATPHFYAKRTTWIAHLGNVIKDKEAIIEFESRMRMIATDWNRIYSMKGNTERLKRYIENPRSVQFR